MDPYLYYVPEYRVIICRQCCVAVWQSALVAHFRRRTHELTLPQIHAVATDLVSRKLDLCRPQDVQLPTTAVLALLDVPIYRDGQRCMLDSGTCAYICRSEKVLRKHWQKHHKWRLCQSLGGSGQAKKESVAERLQMAVRRPVLCQQLFSAGSGSRFFEVFDSVRSPPTSTSNLSTKDVILSKLTRLERGQKQAGSILVATSSSKEISPWLQLTRWLGYLDGHSLNDVARLAWLPELDKEVKLLEVCRSIDRLVDAAILAVEEDRINPFDQMRINSFMQRPKTSDKPLAFKLQKSTYRTYKDVWKRLLCFIYRTMEYSHAPQLRQRLSNTQVIRYNELLRTVDIVENKCAHGDSTDHELRVSRMAVDESCLQLCISLLDHDLNGDIYESAAVGFLAVAAIDQTKNNLREAHLYGATLSGFVKIAQLLVIQRAVVGVERGEAAHPADLLDEMRERFLVYGTRSPFSWACRLRAYAKKVRDTTTSIGYISWNDESSAVSYKEVTSLSMTCLREFIRRQVGKAQTQLEELLLLHPQESRESLGVAFRMHQVTDNASESQCGWNFLESARNQAGPLPKRDHWLLERVLDEDWLKEEFLKDDGHGCIQWRPAVVERYKVKVTAFLETLSLLVHITGGQPGRGTEILSLRHTNTVSGYHRNIFVDSGMVNTVTTYHKGYSITGSVKIIHRFLPKEVGELLIYYLWLVLPFCRKLDLLVFQSQQQPSPFLWPKSGGLDCWSSERLSQVLRREFKAMIGVPISIIVWRHLAIAISRKHLACGGFKRDYDVDDTAYDTQSSHTSRTAGSVYARGMEEAAGHIEARRASYRTISQEWHAFLGFLPPKLPLREISSLSAQTQTFVRSSSAVRNCAKRPAEELGEEDAGRKRNRLQGRYSYVSDCNQVADQENVCDYAAWDFDIGS